MRPVSQDLPAAVIHTSYPPIGACQNSSSHKPNTNRFSKILVFRQNVSSAASSNTIQLRLDEVYENLAQNLGDERDSIIKLPRRSTPSDATRDLDALAPRLCDDAPPVFLRDSASPVSEHSSHQDSDTLSTISSSQGPELFEEDSPTARPNLRERKPPECRGLELASGSGAQDLKLNAATGHRARQTPRTSSLDKLLSKGIEIMSSLLLFLIAVGISIGFIGLLATTTRNGERGERTMALMISTHSGYDPIFQVGQYSPSAPYVLAPTGERLCRLEKLCCPV